MITITIKEAATARGITSSYQLIGRLTEAGYPIVPAMASKLWKNEMVTLPTLDKVAEALDCKLDELYHWEPNKKAARANGKR